MHVYEEKKTQIGVHNFCIPYSKHVSREQTFVDMPSVEEALAHTQ